MSNLVPLPDPGTPLLYGAPGRPLVIVVHDSFGRLPWLEPFGEALADRGGFRVVIPDLYDGVATTDLAQATELQGELSPASVDGQLDRLIAEARDEGSEHVGLLGFSTGGGHALRYAQTGAADAVVAYYATLTADAHGILPAPVLLHLAEFDSWDDGADPESFVSRLKEHGTPVVQHVAAGTVHGFANASLRDTVDPTAAALAFARSTVFLEEHLN